MPPSAVRQKTIRGVDRLTASTIQGKGLEGDAIKTARDTRIAPSYLTNTTESMPLSWAAATISASKGRPERMPVAVHSAQMAVLGGKGLPKSSEV
jgi:hypothetical protein